MGIIHEFLFNGGRIRFIVILYFQLEVLSITIIPFFVFALIHYNITLQKRLKMAMTLNENLSDKTQDEGTSDYMVTINSENKKENLEISISDFLYATSSDNYIDVYFHKGKGIAHNLVRYSLAGVETDNAEKKDVWRCHKSYIINKRKIESVSGNAAGYRIKLFGCDISIPVSRKLNKNLSALISE